MSREHCGASKCGTTRWQRLKLEVEGWTIGALATPLIAAAWRLQRR